MSSNHGRAIIPCLRCRDAHAGIARLCHAFGLSRHAVHENEQGSVEYAQLTYGNGMIMLGKMRDNTFGN